MNILSKSGKLSWGLAAVFLGLAFASSAPAQEEYLIGGGDVLQVNIWKNAELSQTVTVRPDGRITLPLVRDIMASGFTAEELGTVVSARLSAFVNAPNVTVALLTAGNYRVYTQGAIATGMHVLPGPTTARQLLSRAGGVDPAADLSRAFVLRGEARVPVDLSPEPEGDGGAAADAPLLAGDVLVVPSRDTTAGRVLVAGEVTTPQVIPFEPGLTLLDAYLRAGSGTPAADLKGTRIAREQSGAEPVEIRVNLEDILARGAIDRNIALVPGDVIVVPRLPEVARVLIAGEVQTPRSLAFREGLTVLDLFVEAGGGTEYADLDSTKVVRRGAGGKLLEIPVDLARVLKRGDLKRNVDLLPGDVVVVPR